MSAPVPLAPIDGSPIAWKTVSGIKAGDRPLLVWIAHPTADAAVERRAFDDDTVSLASRAFRTVRITPDAAKRDTHLAPYAALGPALVVFSPNLERATVTIGPALDTSGTLGAMRRSAKDELSMDLDAAVTRARQLLADLRTGEDLKVSLRRTAPDDKVRATELDRRLAALRSELETVLRPPLRGTVSVASTR